ncbi:MAG: hypothetical protein Q7R95_01090 [bacterium]|nr:hypothetical protein [bacterium]
MKKEILAFKKVRNELVVLVGLVSLDKREVKLFGDWSLKDLLAHFIGWSDYQIEVLNEFAQHKQSKIISDVQKYNEKSVITKKEWHWDKTYTEFLKSTEKLISTYMSLPDNYWDKPIWKNKKVTPQKLLEIETKHYVGEHLKSIIKII